MTTAIALRIMEVKMTDAEKAKELFNNILDKVWGDAPKVDIHIGRYFTKIDEIHRMLKWLIMVKHNEQIGKKFQIKNGTVLGGLLDISDILQEGKDE